MGNYIPEGSYKLTSRKIKVVLSAECRKINGSWKYSGLDITNINNADIANMDGVLTNVGTAPPDKKNPYLPNGSYKLTSSDIRVTLYTECERIDRAWQSSSLDITNFLTDVDVANIDGVLQVQYWWCQIFSLEQEQQIKQAPKGRILAAVASGVLWDNYIDITYSIEAITKFPPGAKHDYIESFAERERIIDAAFDEWNKVKLGVTFKKISSSQWSQANIRITRHPDVEDYSVMGKGALSYSKDKGTMNLGMRKGLGDAGHVTALHEIGHALGFVHEHQRVDSKIRWNKQATYDYYANRQPVPITDHAIINKAVFSTESGFEKVHLFFGFGDSQFPYDQKSVMNYDFPAQCFDAPDELKRNGIQRSKHLTDTDKATALYFYPPRHDDT